MIEPFQPDKSGVPSEKLTDPRVKEIEHRLREVVSDKKRRRCACVHEAAHFVYAKRAGAIDFTFRGPAILYDERTDTFGGSIAAVQPTFPDKRPEECTALAVARWHAAGCMAECLLTDSGDIRSDSLDFEVFRKRFSELRGNEEIWEEAKRDVRKDLRSPARRKELWAVADQLEKEFFE
jgi:hypothetical protein